MNSIRYTSYINIVVNLSPNPGFFKVDPMSGFELEEYFTLTSYQWTDSDLPLSFQFGYISALEKIIVMRTRAELSFVKTYLPSNCNMTVAITQVFDYFTAFQEKL
jgi:hypothetical protein